MAAGARRSAGGINSNAVSPGDELQADLDGQTLPAAGTGYTVSVSTTSDTTPVTSSNTFSVVPAQSLSGVTVSVDGPSDAAGARSQLRVDFTVSSTGGLNNTDDGQWYITLPTGTGLNAQGQVTDLTTGEVVAGVGGCGGTTLCGGINSNAVSPGDELQADLDGQTLPAAGTGYTVSVSTTSDTTPVTSSNTFSVVPAQTVLSPHSSLSQSASGAAGVTYDVDFTASSTGGLNNTDDGQWFITLPAGTGVMSVTGEVTDLTTGEVVAGVGSCGGTTLCGGINSNAVSPGDELRAELDGVTNVTTAGTHALSITTSSDVATASASFTTDVSSTVSGTVFDANSNPVPSTPVQICPSNGGPCEVGSTTPEGTFSIDGETSGTYDVVALAPAGSGGAESAPIAITVDDPNPVTGVNVVLPSTSVLPPGSSITSGGTTQQGNVPTLYWGNPSSYKLQGCKGGIGVLVVGGINTQTGQPQLVTVPLVETPPDSGNYVAQIPPLAPIHGASIIRTSITCIPTVHLYPDGGSGGGGVPVFISGTGFTGAKGVEFGGVPAQSFVVKTDGLIEAVSPTTSGNVKVTVTLADGTKVTVGSFHTMSVASISTSGCSPSGGDAVITGSGFTGASAVLYGGSLAASVSVESDTKIKASCPIGEVGAATTVVNGLGSASGAAIPESPGGGPHGSLTDVITCIGGAYSLFSLFGVEGAGDASTAADVAGALLGGGSEGVIVDTFTLIAPELFVPAALIGLGLTAYETYKSLHTCDNLLIDPSGTIVDTHGVPISGATVTLLQQSDPPIGAFSAAPPMSGEIEPDVNPETTGSNGEYDWDAIAGTYEITASAPGCTAPGHPTQSDVTSSPFTLPPPEVGLDLVFSCASSTAPTPEVTGLSTSSGPTTGGSLVDLYGTDLSGATAVHFGGKLATSETVLSPYAIAAVVPPGSAAVDVTVTTPGGTSAASSADRYTYVVLPKLADGPTVTSVSPTSGLLTGGSTVTITGTNLKSVAAVSFGFTSAVKVIDVSSTEVQAVSPAGVVPGNVDVSVAGSDGASPTSSGDGFSYVAASTSIDAPTISSVVASGTSALVTWIVANAQGGAAITGFKVVATPLHGAKELVTTYAAASASTVELTSLLLGATYEISVSSTTATGESAPSMTTIVVPKTVTTASLTASPRSPTQGALVTFKATIMSNGEALSKGHVTFLEGHVAIKGCSWRDLSKSGVATCHVRLDHVGRHSISVRFGGTSALQVSSASVTVEVKRKKG